MNEPYIYEGSIVHQVGGVVLENDAEGTEPHLDRNTFIHAVIDGKWRHVGGIWFLGGAWWYYIPSNCKGWTDKGSVMCASPLDGINTVLRESGAIA